MTEIEKIELVLKKIDEKAKTMPKELEAYLHTLDNLMDDDYIAYLDEASGEDIIIWNDINWEENINATI